MITNDELEAKLQASPSPNRVTKESIEAKIQSRSFDRATDTLTVCVVVMRNGFCVVGTSACADPANYNQEIGEKVAYDDAVDKLWALEGYLLREKLFMAAGV